MQTTGWLFDLYPLHNRMVLWFITEAGRRLRLEDDFPYCLYLGGPQARLHSLARALGQKGWLRRAYPSRGRDLWTGLEIPVVALEVKAYGLLPRVRQWLGTLPSEVACYNCDLDIAAAYLYSRRFWPCAWYGVESQDGRLLHLDLLEDPFAVEFSVPPLATLTLSLTRDHLIPLGAGNGLAVGWEARTLELDALDKPGLVRELAAWLRRADPDLVLSDYGDDVIIPTLWDWSREYWREPPPGPGSAPGPPARGRRPQLFFLRPHRLSGIVGPFCRPLAPGPAQLLLLPGIGPHGPDPDRQDRPDAPPTGGPVQPRDADHLHATGPGRWPTASSSPGAKPNPNTSKPPANCSPSTRAASLSCRPSASTPGWRKWTSPPCTPPSWPSTISRRRRSTARCCSGTGARGQGSGVSELANGDHCLPLVLPAIPVGATRRVAPAWPSSGHDPVPEAGYRLCHRREGLVPRTLRPILALREQLKARAKELPPEEAAPYKQRQTALKWMLVTCFGYLGYKNARFGRIEAHEAVTAYGRDKLLCAKETFEAAGFTVLHGLTDCLWVQKPGGDSGRGGPGCPPSGEPTRECAPPGDQALSLTATQYEAELEELCAKVFRVTGVKLALEGVYRWIFFMASKQDPQRPVATRYFGVFADGSLKVRGLMCRRRDTPPFVRRAQEALLAQMAGAATPEDLAALRPLLLEMAEGFRQRLREGGVNPQDLIITRVLSQPVADYQVDTPTALAARQLEAAGIHLQPGEKVRYVHQEGKRGPKECRVQAAPFLEALDGYDTKLYLDLLDRAVAEVMVALEWTVEKCRAGTARHIR